jgi:hypothetical protein
MSKNYLACKEFGLDVTIGIRIRAEIKVCIYEENQQLFVEASSHGASKSWPLNANQCVKVTLSNVGFKICIEARDATSVRIQPKVTIPIIGDIKMGGGVVLRFGPIPQAFMVTDITNSTNGFNAELSSNGSSHYAFFEEEDFVNEPELETVTL